MAKEKVRIDARVTVEFILEDLCSESNLKEPGYSVGEELVKFVLSSQGQFLSIVYGEKYKIKKIEVIKVPRG